MAGTPRACRCDAFDPHGSKAESKSRTAARAPATSRCAILSCEARRHWAVRRREFITLIGGAAAAWPLAARAQPTRAARLGSVSRTGSAPDPGPFVAPLPQAMTHDGHADWKEFIIRH